MSILSKLSVDNIVERWENNIWLVVAVKKIKTDEWNARLAQNNMAENKKSESM